MVDDAWSKQALLTVAESRAYDAAAAQAGLSERLLMETAGAGVAAAFQRRWPGRAALVLCGPGGNGGDGYVAARRLAAAGASVRVAAADEGGSGGAAAQARASWPGPIEALGAVEPRGGEAVIDALFGAGLSRPLTGAAALWAERSPALDVLAVDVPSGIPGDGAAPSGPHLRAVATVALLRKRPAHVLEPGRTLCGEVSTIDLGGPTLAAAGVQPTLFENHPTLWPGWPRTPEPQSHKHNRGRLLVSALTDTDRPSATLGAQRLAARAGQRLGAGWVSVACAAQDVALFQEPASLVALADPSDLVALARRYQAVVLGPGAGLGARARMATLALLQGAEAAVVDADALTAFAADPPALFAVMPPRCVLTPHAGEFARLFPSCVASPTKPARAAAAAANARAVVLLKGPDTTIAAPDGRVVIHPGASPWLATAGTGDVLAGFVGALLAQGAPALEAAAAAVWLHAAAAAAHGGPGLIADDLIAAAPAAWADLIAQRTR